MSTSLSLSPVGRRRRVGQTRRLAELADRIDPEPVHAPVEPEREHAIEVFGDVVVRPVEIGLLRRERLEVPLSGGPVGFGDSAPGRATEHGGPVVRRLGAVGATPVAEVEPVAFGTERGRGDGGTEPRVIPAAMVRHHIHHDSQSELVSSREQRVERLEPAVVGLDVEVVGDVVAVVVLRGRVARRQPQRVDAETGDVRQPVPDTDEIADAVTVAVGERADIDLVDDGCLPPAPRRRGHTSAARRDVAADARSCPGPHPWSFG